MLRVTNQNSDTDFDSEKATHKVKQQDDATKMPPTRDQSESHLLIDLFKKP